MNERPKKRRFRYRLRTLFALLTIVAVVLTLLPYEAREYQARKQRVQRTVESLGGKITVVGHGKNSSPGANWLSVRLGYVDEREPRWEVDLAGKQVTLELVRELSKGRWIRALDLSNTDVSDDALQYLANIDMLRVLRLANSRITDAGLGHLERLKWLAILDVHGTVATYEALARLEQSCPGSTFQCQLARARLDGGPFRFSGRRRGGLGTPSPPSSPLDDGYFPPSEMWTHTVSVSSDRQLTLQQVEDLRHLTSLSSLSVSADVLPPNSFGPLVSNLKALYQLGVDERNAGVLADGGLRALAGLPRLTELHIQGARLRDDDFTHLADATSLQMLDINGSNTLTPALLSHFRDHPSLRRVSLSLQFEGKTNRLTEDVLASALRGMADLGTMPNLEQLSLYGACFTDEVVAPLSQVPTLRHLLLYHTSCSTAAFEELQQALPDCEIRRISSD
jgi:hypothetical protein